MLSDGLMTSLAYGRVMAFVSMRSDEVSGGFIDAERE